MAGVITAIGLMSGTSLDGIDVALVATDGDRQIARGPSLTFPYTASQRARLQQAVASARRLSNQGGTEAELGDAALLAAVERELTELHAEAVGEFMLAYGLPRDRIAALGFHGQTVFHGASMRLSRQIGDGSMLARATGIDVVYDFRAADLAAGGEGAPLAPVYHRALAEAAGLQWPVAVVNIGGVANVTFVGANGALIAFDVGPGNGLIDDWMAANTADACDKDGALARQGRPSEALLAKLLAQPFFARRPPKSLDRQDFAALGEAGLSLEDGLATLVALTARAIAGARSLLPEAPRLWVLAGGGAHNATLVEAIVQALDAPVVRAEEVGWSSDHLEAEAFAYLAVRALRKLPLTFPGTTGVRQPLSGGRIARAPRR